MNILDEAGK